MTQTGYAHLNGPEARAAYAQDRAESYAEMAAERYAACRRHARAGDTRSQRAALTAADNLCKRAEEWAARAMRDHIDDITNER